MTDYHEDPNIGSVVERAIDEWKTPAVARKEDNSLRDYHRYVYRKWIFMAVCLAITVGVVGFAMTIGDTRIGIGECYATVWNHITGNITDPFTDYIIVELRCPRIVIGLIAGAGLAVCGCVMQSIMMNPLTDPYTTGVSSGALFGVTLAMIAGYSVVEGQNGLLLNAFLFSLIPTMVIILVSKMRNVSPTVMVMAGISVMYVFNALTTMMKLWANPSTLSELYTWSVGSLSLAGWAGVPYLVALVLPGAAIMMLLSRQINVLTTGDENATAMGINVNQLRRILLVLIALVAADIVAFTGMIGFVGLIAPHVCRIFIGADNRFMIPASAMFGAMLLVTADLIGRTLIAPSILQVGVITSFLGGPMFLWLILRKNSRVW